MVGVQIIKSEVKIAFVNSYLFTITISNLFLTIPSDSVLYELGNNLLLQEISASKRKCLSWLLTHWSQSRWYLEIVFGQLPMQLRGSPTPWWHYVAVKNFNCNVKHPRNPWSVPSLASPSPTGAPSTKKLRSFIDLLPVAHYLKPSYTITFFPSTFCFSLSYVHINIWHRN